MIIYLKMIVIGSNYAIHHFSMQEITNCKINENDDDGDDQQQPLTIYDHDGCIAKQLQQK